MRTQQEDKSAGLVRIALDGFLVCQGACAPRHFRGDSEARCPFCPTQQAGEDLIPAPAHVCSSFPSFTPLGHGEHLVHLPIMNYTGGRSRYISSLSIIQRIFFFFFFTMGQYKQRWHFSFPEAQGNFYCFTSSWGTLKNQSVQAAGPRGCLDAPKSFCSPLSWFPEEKSFSFVM